MENIFEVTTTVEKGNEIVSSVGIRLKIGGHEIVCPVSRACNTYEALQIEVQAIKNDLESILERAKQVYRQPKIEEGIQLRPDMAPEEIWTVLSGVSDETLFVESFNGLDESKRREVAEYVLTKCNIFSGKASVFSSRYNSETALMD